MTNDEMTREEEQVIDERIEGINDDEKRYTTEEVADSLDIDLED